MRDALFFGIFGALVLVVFGLAYAASIPAGDRQALLIEIAMGEGGTLPPTTGLIFDQLSWVVAHRLGLLSVWSWLTALGAVVGIIEGMYGRLVWRHGGSSVLNLAVARLMPFIAASAAVVAMGWPGPLNPGWIAVGALAVGILLPWSMIRGIPTW